MYWPHVAVTKVILITLLLLYKIAIIDFVEELAYVRRRRNKKNKKIKKKVHVALLNLKNDLVALLILGVKGHYIVVRVIVIGYR